MFTGIIKHIGKIERIVSQMDNLLFQIKSPISKDLKIDESISHNGVCLTVVNKSSKWHEIIAVKETLERTNLGQLKVDDSIHLERSLRLHDLVGGHLIQGHVDCVSTCVKVKDCNGSWIFKFSLDNNYSNLIVPKGSIAINGVSLTVSKLKKHFFEVSIIPYTFENTLFKSIKSGDPVNLEFDIVGKYISRSVKLYSL